MENWRAEVLVFIIMLGIGAYLLFAIVADAITERKLEAVVKREEAGS